MLNLNKKTYFLIFAILSLVSPSNLYNSFSFTFAKQNTPSVFSLVPFDVASGAVDDPGHPVWDNPQAFNIAIKMRCPYIKSRCCLFNSDYIQWDRWYSFLGSTHTLIDCIGVISMTLGAALSSVSLISGSFLADMLIKQVTFMLYLWSLSKSQLHKNFSFHKGIDTSLCSSKSLI